MQNKKGSVSIILLSMAAVTGCDNPVEKTLHLTSGYIQETVLDNFNQGKGADDLRKTHLEIIKNGVSDLETMNDPNIAEIYNIIDNRLKDNELSMYDYNTISSEIHKHKVAINKQNSNHQNDVADFKKNL